MRTRYDYYYQIVETDNSFDFRDLKSCGELNKYDYIEIKFSFTPSSVIPAKVDDIPERCYPEEGIEMEYEVTAITMYRDSDNKREIINLHDNFVPVIMSNEEFAKTVNELVEKYDEEFEVTEPDIEPDNYFDGDDI